MEYIIEGGALIIKLEQLHESILGETTPELLLKESVKRLEDTDDRDITAEALADILIENGYDFARHIAVEDVIEHADANNLALGSAEELLGDEFKRFICDIFGSGYHTPNAELIQLLSDKLLLAPTIKRVPEDLPEPKEETVKDYTLYPDMLSELPTDKIEVFGTYQIEYPAVKTRKEANVFKALAPNLDNSVNLGENKVFKGVFFDSGRAVSGGNLSIIDIDAAEFGDAFREVHDNNSGEVLNRDRKVMPEKYPIYRTLFPVSNPTHSIDLQKLYNVLSYAKKLNAKLLNPKVYIEIEGSYFDQAVLIKLVKALTNLGIKYVIATFDPIGVSRFDSAYMSAIVMPVRATYLEDMLVLKSDCLTEIHVEDDEDIDDLL